MKKKLYALVFLVGLSAPAMAQQSSACTATIANGQLPYTITAPGVYCLTADINLGCADTTSVAITINNAAHTVIDLNGYNLQRPVGGCLVNWANNTNIGIYALDRRNVTVKNGSIRGFYRAIVLDDSGAGVSQGHLIDGLKLELGTHGGIYVRGKGNIVRRNAIAETGGSSVTPDVYGIWVNGDGRVLDNDLFGLNHGLGGVAEAVKVENGVSVVEHARVGNPSVTTSYGVRVLSGDAFVVNSRLGRLLYGVLYEVGAAGLYRDNMTYAVTNPYGGGTNAGNNQ